MRARPSSDLNDHVSVSLVNKRELSHRSWESYVGRPLILTIPEFFEIVQEQYHQSALKPAVPELPRWSESISQASPALRSFRHTILVDVADSGWITNYLSSTYAWSWRDHVSALGTALTLKSTLIHYRFIDATGGLTSPCECETQEVSGGKRDNDCVNPAACSPLPVALLSCVASSQSLL